MDTGQGDINCQLLADADMNGAAPVSIETVPAPSPTPKLPRDDVPVYDQETGERLLEDDEEMTDDDDETDSSEYDMSSDDEEEDSDEDDGMVDESNDATMENL